MQLKRQSVEAWQNEKPYSKENNTSENPIPRREILQSVDHVKYEGQVRNICCLCSFFVELLRLLTHVGLVRQNVLILSEVSLYVEKSKNLEKKYVITVQKKFTFLRGFDRKNKVFGISRNLIDRFVFK